MRRLCFLLITLVVGACADQTVGVTQGYTRALITDPMDLAFQPSAATLEPESSARLRSIRQRLTSRDTPTLLAAGPLALQRAQDVANTLNRLIELEVVEVPAGAENHADLLLTTERLVPASCLGPGQKTARNIWPGDDADRGQFMPPGCATANAVEAMVVNPSDLLRGRPLAPGAALPLARAVERYYLQPNRRTLGLGGSAIDAGGIEPASAPAGSGQVTAQPTAGSTEAGAGLLQGPLTPTGQAPAGQAPAPTGAGSGAQPAASAP